MRIPECLTALDGSNAYMHDVTVHSGCQTICVTICFIPDHACSILLITIYPALQMGSVLEQTACG